MRTGICARVYERDLGPLIFIRGSLLRDNVAAKNGSNAFSRFFYVLYLGYRGGSCMEGFEHSCLALPVYLIYSSFFIIWISETFISFTGMIKIHNIRKFIEFLNYFK